VRRALGLGLDRYVVLFVGKIEPKKRLDDVIRAMPGLGDAQLLVVGRGPEESAARALAEQLGVEAVFAGFRNQGELPALYRAADVLSLPSDARETFGLVVNEALACGLPCVVSDAVGCAVDLVVSGKSGESHPVGDVPALTAALQKVRGAALRDACAAQALRSSFANATAGLVAAAQSLTRRAGPRVLVCMAGSWSLTGLERSTIDVIDAMRRGGDRIHVLVHPEGGRALVPELEALGASWEPSLGYAVQMTRHGGLPALARLGLDVAAASAELGLACARLGATHLLLPDLLIVLRLLPTLALLRARGVRVVVKLGNAPERTRLVHALWKHVVDPVVDRMVCNSAFTQGELTRSGVDPAKVTKIYLTAPRREATRAPLPVRDRWRVVFVGQLRRGKGLDLLLEAIARLRAGGIPATLAVAAPVGGWVPADEVAYQQAIFSRIERDDLRGHVDLLGWREDVPAVFATARVHCCPSTESLREAFGLVNVEAKQAGVPSVVSPFGAMRELFTHKVDGWICEPFDVATIADGIAYFLTDEARWTAASEAARRSFEHYSFERFAAAWRAELSCGAER